MSTIFSAIDVGQKIVIKELIDILKQELVWYKTAKVHPVSKGSNSKTVVFRGFNKLALALNPLTEGVTPPGSSLTMNSVTAVLSQYGDFTTITDVVEFLYDRSMIKDASEVLGIQSTETIDTTIMNVVGAGTNVVYGDGSVSARSSVTSSMTLTTTLIRRYMRFLRRNNVKKFPVMPIIGNAYALIAHPDVCNDLRNDSSFVSAINYSSPTPNQEGRGNLFTGELGYWQGVRIIETTISPVYAGAGSGSVDIYGVICYGVGAYAVSEFQGGLKTYIHTGGVQDTSDPLEQRSTVGWKWEGVAAILDNNRLVRGEVGATLTGTSA
ncbi:MAG: N4-gp56 family major capsid protein [Patescibacteria group bacterium]|nr:N4-gp56 family major capsid protein [Patescibacteria group bacterium]